MAENVILLGEVAARGATMIDIRCSDVIDMGVCHCSVCVLASV